MFPIPFSEHPISRQAKQRFTRFRLNMADTDRTAELIIGNDKAQVDGVSLI